MKDSIRIKLSEKYYTIEEFEEIKEKIKNMKGAKLVEIAPNEFKLRLRD
jgi:hypothetical protein